MHKRQCPVVMMNKASKKHSQHCYSWLLVLHSLGCHGDAREGRGLEDTVVGPCHREGVGWRGKSITLVDEPDMFEDMMTVHWTRLVERPDCVDKIEIYMNDILRKKEENPADKNIFTFQITRKVCEKEKPYQKLYIFHDCDKYV